MPRVLHDPRPQENVLDGQISHLIAVKGFGFITATDGNTVRAGADYFFHLSDLQNAQLADLVVGDRVQFVPNISTKGNGRRARAVIVCPREP